MTHTTDPVLDFLEAASVPRDASHATGTLEVAESILAAHPEVAGSGIHAAAVLGDDSSIRRLLATNAGLAVTKGGPHNWDPLTYLAFSRYLKLDRARSDGFVRAATALLEAGADPNGGWFEGEHQPKPVWESVLYGVAGIAPRAPHAPPARARRQPNDDETPYHTPEGYDNDALKVLVESGQLTDDNLVTMLIRKRLARSRWCRVPARARRRSQPPAALGLHGAAPRDRPRQPDRDHHPPHGSRRRSHALPGGPERRGDGGPEGAR